MCRDNYEQLLDELSPTFLFTCKGTRSADHKEKYHSHDFMELCFILSGSCQYRIDDLYYNTAAGDVLVFGPGQKHQSVYADSSERASEFFVGFTDVPFSLFSAGSLPIRHTKGDLNQKLFKLCTAMGAENEICRQGRYAMLKSYLIQILILLLRDQREPVKAVSGRSFESTNKTYVVKQIMDYFEDHYDEKISLDQIAGNMYLSPFYISRIFKSETGDTPINHLINIRLEKAKELLEKNRYESIQVVAAQVGYDDAYHFSKLFKKKYGIPPSHIRNSK